MLKEKKQGLIIFLIIVGVASFFRLYLMVPIAAMGTIRSPLIGILTVIGLYLLVKELFEWRLAAIASYLMAISFWHVNFSRSEFQAIWVPFIIVYAFYFLWRGLKHNHLSDFFIAGIFWGLACLPAGRNFIPVSYAFLITVIAIVLFINYWRYLKKDFNHAKYEYAKHKLLKGFVLLALMAFVVTLPIGISFWQHQQAFLSKISDLLLVFGQNESIKTLTINIVRTLGMFNFSDSPILPWPIGIFFAAGFINELIHWLKRKHGHFSTVHTFMFLWFFVMLIPGFLSTDEPNPLLIIGALPVVMIFTARGIWWFFDKISGWYKINDPHSIHEAHAVIALVMIVFFFSIGFMEYWRYFK